MIDSGSAFTDYVGVKIIEVNDGLCRATLQSRPDLGNKNGTIHGGASFTLADVAIGWAVRSTLTDQQWCATIELKANFLAAAKGDLACTARVVSRSRTLAYGEAEVVDLASGKLVVKAVGTFAIRD